MVENKPKPTLSIVAEPSAKSASERAKAAKREAISLLDDVFDLEHGRYRGAETDASVGATVGLSADAIRLLRDEFGYAMKRPTELDELATEIVEARKAFDAKLVELAHEISKEKLALHERLDAVQRKVDAFAKRFT